MAAADPLIPSIAAALAAPTIPSIPIVPSAAFVALAAEEAATGPATEAGPATVFPGDLMRPLVPPPRLAGLKRLVSWLPRPLVARVRSRR